MLKVLNFPKNLKTKKNDENINTYTYFYKQFN